MRLKRQVVMLPTNEKANGVIVIDSFRTIKPNMFIVTNNNCQHEDYIPQHLYILSDEKIEKGDWCVEFVNNIPTNILQIKGNDFERCLHNYEKLKKIIATTDRSLRLNSVKISPSSDFTLEQISKNMPSLPQLSNAFIQKYVDSYNKGNIITDVMVEYEIKRKFYCDEEKCNPNNFCLNQGRPSLCEIKSKSDDFNQLKVDKDNCISIYKVKDNYSRTEVIQLIDNLYEQGGFDDYLDELLDKNNIIKEVSFSESDAGKKWIEENL